MYDDNSSSTFVEIENVEYIKGVKTSYYDSLNSLSDGTVLVDDVETDIYRALQNNPNVYLRVTSNIYICNKCFVEDTLITLSDYSTKMVKDITYEDELLAFNFDTGEMDSAKIAWLSKPHTSDNYFKVVLSDGSILKLVGWNNKCHRLFNYEQGTFLYPQDFNEGEHTLNQNNELVTIVSIENIKETVTYYNLTTAYRLNNFANGICVGSRLSNLYSIKDFKYVKEERIPISDFKNIPQHYIDELRLLEQKEQNPDNSVIYKDTLEDHIYNNYYKQDIRYREY